MLGKCEVKVATRRIIDYHRQMVDGDMENILWKASSITQWP